MAEPFLGEIRPFAFNRIPWGWLPCEGQELQIQSYQALFSLLGVTYGGNGSTTFKLPDLRGRVPLHKGNTVAYGAVGGEATHTLSVSEIPAHTHQVYTSSGTANQPSPENNTWGSVNGRSIYATTANTTMSPAAMSATGQSNAHNNMQPYLTLSFCIAVQGIYPIRN